MRPSTRWAARLAAPLLCVVPMLAAAQATIGPGPAPVPATAPASAVPAAQPVPAPPPPLTPADGAAIAAAARAAAQDGLAVADLDPLAAALSAPDATARAGAEAMLSLAAVRIAEAQHGRLANPRAVDSDWALRAPFDAAKAFAAARAAGTIPAWAAALRPVQPGYVTLAAARARYADLAAKGGWPLLGAGPKVAVGAADPRVAILRARLAAEGYATPEIKSPETTPEAALKAASVLDLPLSEALKAFQSRHALPANGVLDAATQAELDVPAATRLAVIDLNLERERWLPAALPADRIEVDIAAQVLTVFQSGQAALTMRAIVGNPTHHTPSFTTHTTAVVFNPPWVVPSSIASAELYPKERRSPGYFARNGFHIVGGQLVQAPGPKAALGYVKFDLVSPFGVYLHDTPSRSLFKRDRRALSHGCMRLEMPRELAALLLGKQGWSRADVDAAIAAGATRRVGLAIQTPVFVVYRTVTADAAGVLSVRPDIYGWDAKLAAALQGQPAAVVH
ncbi:MAG: L,D-transpeptidase family protein [Proteobacteria bacterium]|nr:L,D-transpeptidase family protein [Pseudomonadota bacterium]